MKSIFVCILLFVVIVGVAHAGCNVNMRTGSAVATQHHNWIGPNPSNNYHVTWRMRATTAATSDHGHVFQTYMHLKLGSQVQATGITYPSWFRERLIPTTSVFSNTASGNCTECDTILNTVVYKDGVWEFDNELPEYP